MTLTAPLADLHRHLDGSLRPETLRELAEREGLALPSDVRFVPGMGLDEALARFELTLGVLQDPASVRRVAAEICEDAALEGVTTLEIRFAPQLHRGAGVEAVVDAACEGADGRGGIILCGLYGEAPSVLELLVEVARRRPAVVGIDLAGGPTGGHEWRLEDYAAPFARARDLGIGRTVHAGEGRPPAEIRVAIERLFAERIGHGTTLLDDPRVLDLVLEREVTIEACLTSNFQTGAIPALAGHPLPRWLDHGVKVCVCTDNTLFSDVDAPQEHRRAAAVAGMTEDHLERVIAAGHAAAFRRA